MYSLSSSISSHILNIKVPTSEFVAFNTTNLAFNLHPSRGQGILTPAFCVRQDTDHIKTMAAFLQVVFQTLFHYIFLPVITVLGAFVLMLWFCNVVYPWIDNFFKLGEGVSTFTTPCVDGFWTMAEPAHAGVKRDGPQQMRETQCREVLEPVLLEALKTFDTDREAFARPEMVQVEIARRLLRQVREKRRTGTVITPALGFEKIYYGRAELGQDFDDRTEKGAGRGDSLTTIRRRNAMKLKELTIGHTSAPEGSRTLSGPRAKL